jgi:hypothetical protein
VDFAFSEELALDHAEIAPMMHLTPRWDIPIIPIGGERVRTADAVTQALL